MKVKWILIILALVFMVFYGGCNAIKAYNTSVEHKWEQVAEQYSYKSVCPQRHEMPFYSNDYAVERGAIVLYDAYVFVWGWKEVDVYKYPVSVTVTIVSVDNLH